jgi:TPR repeat protein
MSAESGVAVAQRFCYERGLGAPRDAAAALAARAADCGNASELAACERLNALLTSNSFVHTAFILYTVACSLERRSHAASASA